MASSNLAGELDELTDVDLETKLRESKEELFNLRFQMATGQLQNHRQIRHVREDLAQILTTIHLTERNPESPSIEPEAPAAKPRRRRAAATEEKA